VETDELVNSTLSAGSSGQSSLRSIVAGTSSPRKARFDLLREGGALSKASR
jgi:hypothetical protein